MQSFSHSLPHRCVQSLSTGNVIIKLSVYFTPRSSQGRDIGVSNPYKNIYQVEALESFTDITPTIQVIQMVSISL